MTQYKLSTLSMMFIACSPLIQAANKTGGDSIEPHSHIAQRATEAAVTRTARPTLPNITSRQHVIGMTGAIIAPPIILNHNQEHSVDLEIYTPYTTILSKYYYVIASPTDLDNVSCKNYKVYKINKRGTTTYTTLPAPSLFQNIEKAKDYVSRKLSNSPDDVSCDCTVQ